MSGRLESALEIAILSARAHPSIPGDHHMGQQSLSLERLLDRLQALDAETLVEVEDFVEFLFQKKRKPGRRLHDRLRERALPSVTLEQVRADLSTITGSLADVVTQLRQERG
jgi:hypothetical protein